MQQPFEQFVRALRSADVKVSVAEVIDATEVIAAVGYDDRQLLKDALGLTVAKSQDEKDRFDVAFELFYARTEFKDAFDAWDDPDKKDPDAKGNDEDCAPDGGDGGDADGSGDGDGSAEGGEGSAPGMQSDLADMILAGDGEALASAMEAAAVETGAANIKVFTQRGYLARQMLDEMGMRDLERMIAAMEHAAGDEAEEDSKIKALTEGRMQLFAEARNYMERQFELYARAAGQQFREEFLETTAMSNIPPRDFEIMNRIVRRMAKKLASKYMRRHRRAKRGQLDVRRTLRRNMAHDGVPFETVWKFQEISKPSVVAICDVSGSVAASARFLLMFLYSLNEVIARLQSFAFSSHMEEISDDLENHSVEEAIPVILQKIGFRSTDYGQMLRDFRDDHLDSIDRRTTVIMLGDGRTNDADPEAHIMKQIYERSRRVIWLNPEPESFWGTGDSEMPRYRPYCHVAKTCNTLKQLERIIDDLLRSSVRA
jgi:uncharacterized protein